MTEYQVEAQINGVGRVAGDNAGITAAADRAVWESARFALRERRYRTHDRDVRVRAEWGELAEIVRVSVRVIDESDTLHPADVPGFVELFFHDAFLLFNIAVPGSFGGFIAFAGEQYHVNDLTFDARVFEYAWVNASRSGGPRIEPLPLDTVVSWYDALEIGTQQLATGADAKVLFHLLHLARGGEDCDAVAILRLANAVEMLCDGAAAAEVVGLRDAIVRGNAAVIHPMHDDALDPRIDDPALDWTAAADAAASLVISELQRRATLA